MPDTSSQPSPTADRPEEVTDPLLWNLALAVADAHAPAEDGGCTSLLCAGQTWPCEAWNNAQRALEVARGGAADAPRTPEPPQGRDAITSWSPAPTTALRGWTPPEQQSPQEPAAA